MDKCRLNTLPSKSTAHQSSGAIGSVSQTATYSGHNVRQLNTGSILETIPEDDSDRRTVISATEAESLRNRRTEYPLDTIIDFDTKKVFFVRRRSTGTSSIHKPSKTVTAAAALKHTLAALPPALSIAGIGVSSITTGLPLTAGTIATLALSGCSMLAVGKSVHSDICNGAEDFQDMSDYQICQYLLQCSVDILAASQGVWGVQQAGLGYFSGNAFHVDGLVKRAFDGDWKDIGHAVLGTLCGTIGALSSVCLMRDKDGFRQKINQYLPEIHRISAPTFNCILSLASNIAALGYPVYDVKHTTQASSYSNLFQEFYIPESTSRNVLEAIYNSRPIDEQTQFSYEPDSKKKRLAVACSTLSSLALLAKNAHFFFAIPSGA